MEDRTNCKTKEANKNQSSGQPISAKHVRVCQQYLYMGFFPGDPSEHKPDRENRGSNRGPTQLAKDIQSSFSCLSFFLTNSTKDPCFCLELAPLITRLEYCVSKSTILNPPPVKPLYKKSKFVDVWVLGCSNLGSVVACLNWRLGFGRIFNRQETSSLVKVYFVMVDQNTRKSKYKHINYINNAKKKAVRVMQNYSKTEKQNKNKLRQTE